MKRLLLIGIVFLASAVSGEDQRKHSFVPRNGFVPDANTAIRIAEAVWIPIYGESKIAKERPIKAKLQSGIWVVEGSLQEGFDGGVALAEITKADGRILRVSHGK